MEPYILLRKRDDEGDCFTFSPVTITRLRTEHQREVTKDSRIVFFHKDGIRVDVLETERAATLSFLLTQLKPRERTGAVEIRDADSGELLQTITLTSKTVEVRDAGSGALIPVGSTTA